MIASGFAGLGYQIVWTQQSALWLGHESAAVLAVVAGFFGGLAAGALLLGPRIDRSLNPARWYAGCELAIGVWSLALAVLLGPATNVMLGLIGAQPSPVWHWTVAFVGVFGLLLPATAAMGATLPAMERMLANSHRDGASIPALYAANTFGAVLGVLIAAFVLVPDLGLRATAGVCAVLNVACAMTTLLLFARGVRPRQGTAVAREVSTTSALSAAARADLDSRHPPFPAAADRPHAASLVLLAATGLLGIGYEVLVVRVLSQVAENTVYTFAILLAVYLIGTAAGAALYGRQQRSANGVARTRDRLFVMLAASCMLGMLSLVYAQTVKVWTLHALGASMSAALVAEAVIATTAFLLPTVMMGMVFSHLTTTAKVSGISLGRALGVNTLGAAFAPLVFGVLLVPAIGMKFSLLIVTAGYLVLALRGLSRTVVAGAVGAVALAVWMPSLAIVDVPQGGKVVSIREGSMATVSIVEDARGVSSLHIDNRQQEGSSATVYADARQAVLPILLHPAPKRALFLGLGTGVTASAAAADPALEVDAVELLPEVIEASTYFARLTEAAGSVTVDANTANPRLHLMAADARRFVRATSQHYDVIVSDNFHPARSGSGSLYTVEHFSAVRERLGPGGLFCQWLPLHQLDIDTLRSIVKAYVTVYPHAWAMLATNSLETPVLALVAREDGKRLDINAIHERLAAAATPLDAVNLGIVDDLALLGSFVAGPRSLAQFSEHAPLNTDDHPIVAYRAPRITYAPDSEPRDRLLQLIHQLDIQPDELIDGESPRLASYWSARNRFLEAGRDVHPSPDVKAMLAQVRKPLLNVLRISPDFRPAYDPLLKMAEALAEESPAEARALLTELQQAQPARPEAFEARRDALLRARQR